MSRAIRQQIAQRYGDAFEFPTQPLHPLTLPGYLLQAGINHQLTNWRALVAAPFSIELWTGSFAVRQMDTPFNAGRVGCQLSYILDVTGAIVTVFVDAKTGPLPFDAMLRILVLASDAWRFIGPYERGQNSRRFWADEILIGTVTQARDTNRGMDAIEFGVRRLVAALLFEFFSIGMS